MKTSIFTICEVPFKGFQIAFSVFFFPAYIKILFAGKKKKKKVTLWVFSYCFLKPNNFFSVLTSLRCVFSFLLPFSPPPGWLVGWSIFMFLNLNSKALSLYSLLKGMLSVTSCSSYGSLSKHLIFGSLEGHLLLIGLIWKRRTKTIWMSLQWNLSV